MKRKWKILIIVAVLVTLGAGIYASTVYSRRGIVAVQTGRVFRQDLASMVTASGEIKPRNYINIGANAQGQITQILVKEGDRVRKGQLLARIENVQPEADVAAQRASLASAQADSSAAEAGVQAADENVRTLQASIDRANADLERARVEFNRGQELLKDQLIAQQDFDGRRPPTIPLRPPCGKPKPGSSRRAPSASRPPPNLPLRRSASPRSAPCWSASTMSSANMTPTRRSTAS